MAPSRRAVAAALGAGLGVLVPAFLSRAEAPPGPSSSSAAGASRAAPPSAAASARGLPRFADDLPPPERSPAPSVAEWKVASAFRFDHDRDLPQECRAARVREWVRVMCSGMGASAGLVAGPAEGFEARVPLPRASKDNPGYLVQFPVRRGERRLIELRGANWDENYMGEVALLPGPRAYLSLQWNEGEDPILVAQQ